MTSDHYQVAGQRRVLMAAPLVAALLLGTAACVSGSDGPKSGDSKQPSKTPSASKDPAAVEKTKVLKVVEDANTAQNKLYAGHSLRSSGLEDVVTDKAYTKITSQAANYEMAGVVFKGGKEISDARVTAIETKASSRKATVQKCVDTSGWKPVKKKSGKPVGVVDKTRRYISTDELEIEAGEWKVFDYTLDKGRKC